MFYDINVTINKRKRSISANDKENENESNQKIPVKADRPSKKVEALVSEMPIEVAKNSIYIFSVLKFSILAKSQKWVKLKAKSTNKIFLCVFPPHPERKH